MSVHWDCKDAEYTSESHQMMPTEAMLETFGGWAVGAAKIATGYAMQKATDVVADAAKRQAREAASNAFNTVRDYAVATCATGLAAVGAAGVVAGKAFHAFTPVPPGNAMDKLIDALGKLGQESASKRLSRHVTLAYQSMLGVLAARTLYTLHNVGANDVREALLNTDNSASQRFAQSLYARSDGATMPYYEPYDTGNHNTILSTEGWDLGSIPRGIVNIMLGMSVYVSHVLGVAREAGDTTWTVDKVLKILCYEEVLCRLLNLHGYGALSQASYAMTQLLQNESVAPWYAKGVGQGISTGIAKVHDIVGYSPR